MILFKQEYGGDSLSDLERDLLEMFDRDYNPLADEIPVDEYGIPLGVIEVTVVWKPE
jgi:hypothetical protein